MSSRRTEKETLYFGSQSQLVGTLGSWQWHHFIPIIAHKVCSTVLIFLYLKVLRVCILHFKMASSNVLDLELDEERWSDCEGDDFSMDDEDEIIPVSAQCLFCDEMFTSMKSTFQ